MKDPKEIAEELRNAATAGGDVYNWEFDSESLEIESLEISRGRVSEISLGSEIDITHVDGEHLRDVVIVNKEVFDQALEALDDLSPGDQVKEKIESLTAEINQVRALVGLRQLVDMHKVLKERATS